MKKIYSLLVASFAASLISASAFTPLKPGNAGLRSIDKLATQRTHTVDLSKFENNVVSEKQLQKRNLTALSRAEEGIDLTEYTCHQYYDEFFNWTEPDGVTESQEYRNLLSTTPATITDNENGTWTISGLGGFTFTYDITLDPETGALYAELGQNLVSFETSQGKIDVVLASIVEDANGNYAITNEGRVDFKVYKDAIATFEPLLARIVLNGVGQRNVYCANDATIYSKPNATIEYTIDGQDGSVATIENRVVSYIVLDKVQVNDSTFQEIPTVFISSITPWNIGVETKFTIEEFKNIPGIYALGTIVMASEDTEETDENGQPVVDAEGNPIYIQTGDWYLSSARMDANPSDSEEGLFNLICIANDFDIEDYETEYETAGIYWPYPDDEFGLNCTKWYINSVNGFFYGMFNIATLTFDDVNGNRPSGVKSIVKDLDETAAPVYYNIQGIQVANPQPGQLYIVKQGSKVSKVIK